MGTIPQHIVDEAWQELNHFTDAQIHREMNRLAACQPHLLGFFIEFTQDLDVEVNGLAMFMFVAVYRMFEKCAPMQIEQITDETIETCFEENEHLIESLKGVHERFFQRIAEVQLEAQPNVMRYIVEGLFEAPEDEEDPVELTEEDTGYLFLLLKTVTDLLHKAMAE